MKEKVQYYKYVRVLKSGRRVSSWAHLVEQRYLVGKQLIYRKGMFTHEPEKGANAIGIFVTVNPVIDYGCVFQSNQFKTAELWEVECKGELLKFFPQEPDIFNFKSVKLVKKINRPRRKD